MTSVLPAIPTFDPVLVIRSFDSDYDVPLLHHHAMALLEASRAFESTSTEVAVGASWCRIIRADVEYRLADGLAEIEASRGAARILHEQITLKAENGIAITADSGDMVINGKPKIVERKGTDDFARYACARWHDGAGKLLYRCGDYAEGLVHLERASALAEPLWYCREDIASNLLRSRYDELDMALEQETEHSVEDRIKKEREGIARALLDRLRDADPDVPQGLSLAEHVVEPDHYAASLAADAQAGTLDGQRREHLRGLCSLAHNLSVVMPKLPTGTAVDPVEQAYRWSLCSDRLAKALGDGYRQAQAIQQQAAYFKGQNKRDKALELFVVLEGLPWKRGQLIARQNIAGLKKNAGDLVRMLHAYELGRRDAVLGLDLRRLQWTARFLAECQGEVDPHPYVLRAIRAVRRVVKRASYKRIFAKEMRPVFFEETKRKLGAETNHDLGAPASDQVEDPLEPLLAVVEESSARELLDLVGAIASEEPAPRATLVDDGATMIPVAAEPTDGERRRDVRRAQTGTDLEKVQRREIKLQYDAWEEYMSGRPIPVREHDADIGRCPFVVYL